MLKNSNRQLRGFPTFPPAILLIFRQSADELDMRNRGTEIVKAMFVSVSVVVYAFTRFHLLLAWVSIKSFLFAGVVMLDYLSFLTLFFLFFDMLSCE